MAVLAGHAMALLGSFLPWATVTSAFGTLSVAGTNGDGVITLVAALLGIFSLGAAYMGRSRRAILASMVLGLVNACIGLYDLANLSERIDEVESDLFRVDVGVGLWLVIIGGIVALAAAYMEW